MSLRLVSIGGHAESVRYELRPHAHAWRFRELKVGQRENAN